MKTFFRGRALFFECSFIVLVCEFVYLANHRADFVGDTVPNSLLALLWLLDHQLNFDAFRDGFYGGSYFFLEALNGHLTSLYPIGAAIVTLPIYCLFAIALWLLSSWDSSLLGVTIPIDLTSQNFELNRLALEKLAATLATTLSVVLFYLSANLKFDKLTSLVITFVYAFATSSWTISSQSLWQHTASNLVLTAIILGFLKANRVSDHPRRRLLIAVGLLLGFFSGIRPINLIFNLAAIGYAIVTYRTESRFLLVGFVSALPSLVWNGYYFGVENLLMGGYLYVARLMSYTFKQFVEGFLGLLVSPARGLMIYSPILLYAVPGALRVWRWRSGKDEKLLLSMTIACLVMFFNYCFYLVWAGGTSYGPRFLSDALPIECYLIGYAIAAQVQSLENQTQKIWNFRALGFLAVLIFSTFTQLVGAFGEGSWDMIPIATTGYDTRFGGRYWDVSDNPIARHTKSLVFKILPPPVASPAYQTQLNAAIEQVETLQGEPITAIQAPAGMLLSLKATLHNLGEAHWLGYEAGINQSLVRVRMRIYDATHRLLKEGRLYSSKSSDRQTTIALGQIVLPRDFGTYRLVLDLIAEGLKEIPTERALKEIPIRIGSQTAQFSQNFLQVRFSNQIKAGASAALLAWVENTSNFAWLCRNASNPVTLAYRWLNSAGEIVETGRIFSDADAVPTGGILVRQILKAPQRSGNYTLRLTMVQEGVAWFDERGTAPKDLVVQVK
ncbi:hypothetical protein [Phormidesmis priestleyi]